MNCETCGKSFSGPASYQQHMQSEKHKRKVVAMGFFENKNEPLRQPVSAFNQLHCPACNISFDSIVHFQSHSMTLEHSENVTKEHIKKVDGLPNLDSVSSTSTSNSNILNDAPSKIPISSHDETDTILPSSFQFDSSQLASYAICEICNIQLSGPEPYNQHMASIGHRKKMEMKHFIQNPTNQSQGENMFNRFTCDPCKKVFSGQVPYQQHIISEVHRKKLHSIQLMEQLSENKKVESIMECYGNQSENTNIDVLKNMDANLKWFCKICLIPCSGVVPYNQHLQGDTHYKNLKKAEMISKGGFKSELKSGDLAVPLSPTTTMNKEDTVPTMLPARNKIAESDFVLPDALLSLSVVSPCELNLKEFLPDEKITFDDFENEKPKDCIKGVTNLKIDINSCISEQPNGIANEQNMIEEIHEVYEECKLCNVKLMNRAETISHFESIEHFRKKWLSNEKLGEIVTST